MNIETGEEIPKEAKEFEAPSETEKPSKVEGLSKGLSEKIEQTKTEEAEKNEIIKREAEALLKEAISSLSKKELMDLGGGHEVNKTIDMKQSKAYSENPVALQGQLELAVLETALSKESKFKISYEPVMGGKSEMELTIVKKYDPEEYTGRKK